MGKIATISNEKYINDLELIEKYQSTQDQYYLAVLFDRYMDLIYATCVKYLENQEDAKDAVMSIYEELNKKLLVHEVQNFKSWVYVLAKNYCLMHLRAEKKAPVTSMDNMQISNFEHLDHVIDNEATFKKLESCMDMLQKEQEAVIRMFYYEQKCYNEIVEKTGWEWNKVRSLIQNGRRNLKICMEKNEI